MNKDELQDGINCINIYSQGQTALGKSLSNFADCRIDISLGYFRTIEGLIFFLGSFDNSFRIKSGPAAKKDGKRLNRNITLPEDIFKGLIIEAMEAKLAKDEGLTEALRDSTLPLVHYYNMHGNKVFIPKWDWQVAEWERIRSELKIGKAIQEIY